MVDSEKLLNIIALMKCDNLQKAIYIYRLSIKIAYTKTRTITQELRGSILTKLIEY